MPDTTYEEAKRCPKCATPGRDTGTTTRVKGGGLLHNIVCVNPRCRWYNTSYVVQTNPDGTVPPPTLDREKSFRALPARSDESVDREMQNLLNQQLR